MITSDAAVTGSSRIEKVNTSVLLIGLCGLGLVLRLYRLAAQSLWFDEIFTVLVAQAPFIVGLKSIVVDGVHPPLFYWVVKSILFMGTSEWVVRLPAVIFGVMGIAAIYLASGEWFGKRIGVMAGMLLALSPFHLWYSQDARMYTMLAFLAILDMWGFERVLTKPSLRNYTFFTIVSTLAYLTHYFALFLPLIQLIYLTFNLGDNFRQLRTWIGLQLLAIIPFLGWVYLFSLREIQGFGISWISQPRLMDLLYTTLNFTIGYIPPLSFVDWLVAAGLLFLVMLGVVKGDQKGTLTTLLTLWAFLPPILTLIISTLRPMYVDRYLILSLPPFMILLARGLLRLGRRWWLITSAIMLLIFTVRVVMVFESPDSLKKEEWREVAQYLEANVSEDEIVVPRVLRITMPLRYYLEKNLPQEVMELNGKVMPLEEFIRSYRGAWLVYWNTSTDAHALATEASFYTDKETNPVLSEWILGGGPGVMERRDFKGVTVFHFRLEDIIDLQDSIRQEGIKQ